MTRRFRAIVAGGTVAAVLLAGPIQTIALLPAAHAAPAIPTVDGIARSTSDAIARLYLGLLNREPDLEGLRAWSELHIGGAPLENIAEAFLGSPEYAARGIGADDASFVAALYRDSLARAAGDDEVAAWIAAMRTGMSRGAIANAIAQSGEAVTASGTVAYVAPTPPAAPPVSSTVPAVDGIPRSTSDAIARLYLGLLGRDPDLAGLTGWSRLHHSGTALDAVADAFLASPEYAARNGGLDAAGFVAALYRDALGRLPAQLESANWTGAMSGGATRSAVAIGITQSAEAVAFTRTVAYVVPAAVPPPGAAYPLMGRGASGEAVRRVQQRLLDLGFWHLGADGQFGYTTQQAVLAFQKYFELPRTSRVDERTAFALSMPLPRVQARTTSGSIVEVDKRRQVVVMVRDGRTEWVFNSSTGSGKRYVTIGKNTGILYDDIARTPEGRFSVYREHSDGWRDGDLGRLYRPKYFVGGVAVHGSNSVPSYPASHGCVRVNNPAMDFIWASNYMPIGRRVWVYS